MAAYGAITSEKVVVARARAPNLALAALILCAVALVAATASWVQARPPVALAEFEVVPLGSMGSGNWPLTGLVLGDDLAKNLPEERVFETDGMAPQPRCPGAWCEETPFRIYPDGRPGKNFPVVWGPCNIAIQDC